MLGSDSKARTSSAIKSLKLDQVQGSHPLPGVCKAVGRGDCSGTSKMVS